MTTDRVETSRGGADGLVHWSTWAVAREPSDVRGLAIVVTSLEASPPPSSASTMAAAAARSGLAPSPPSELKLLQRRSSPRPF